MVDAKSTSTATELVTGYRIRQNSNGDFVDIYIYDSLSSGAGYAVSIANRVTQLLAQTREKLSRCTCDTACYDCLKHYRNQFVHSKLDRKAALNLLDWGEKGILPLELTMADQQSLLSPLVRILEQSGISISFGPDKITAHSHGSSKEIVIYPAFWAHPSEPQTIFVSDAIVKYAKPFALTAISNGLA